MFANSPRRKPAEFERAKMLRAEGRSVGSIARELGVSRGTASAWVRDVELTTEQAERNFLAHQGEEAIRTRNRAWSDQCRSRRLAAQAEGASAARKGSLLHVQGCMLYWAEGSKSRNQLEFVNSDKQMMRLFRRFLIEELGVAAAQFRIRVTGYAGDRAEQIRKEDHWLRLFDVSREQLLKCIWNQHPRSSRGLRQKKLEYGVCALRVTRSTDLVQHIYGAVQEYGGFECEAWTA